MKHSFEGGCPYRAAFAAERPSLIKAADNHQTSVTLVSEGKKTGFDSLSRSKAFLGLDDGAQLQVVAALAIDDFVCFVKCEDAQSPGERVSLVLLLQKWEAHIQGLEADNPRAKMIDRFDDLSKMAALPAEEINYLLAQSDIVRSSSALMLVGIQTLQELATLNMNESDVDFIRFIVASMSSHILDPRYDLMDSARMNGRLFERYAFKWRRLKLRVAHLTKGVLMSRQSITNLGTPINVYELLKTPRRGCAVLLSGHVRFLVDREFFGNDF